MDLIREISLTFSKKSYRNFIKFFTRKRPSESRKDVQVFEQLGHGMQGLLRTLDLT